LEDQAQEERAEPMGEAASRTISRAARARVREKERERERGTVREVSQGRRRTREAINAREAMAVATRTTEEMVLERRGRRSTRDGRHFWAGGARGS